MKLLKPTTLAVFAAGFLAGSRAGSRPWDTVESKVAQLQNQARGEESNGVRPTSSPTGTNVQPGAFGEV